MYPATTHSHLHLQQSLPGTASLDQSYSYHHPTPPYYSHSEANQGYHPKSLSPSQQHHQRHLQRQQQQQKYLATPSSVFPAICPQIAPQQQLHHPQHPQHLAASPLVINTKLSAPVCDLAPSSGSASMQSPSASRKQQQQSIGQLAEFAAHMVCYLLYGHQPSLKSSRGHCVGTPPSSIPSSPLPSHSASSCPCESCNRMASYSPTGPAPISTAAYPISQHQSQQARPRHRRMLSESEIVQPKPMFRKFCLDVLSATLLSPSVILLSLKYIQQLMINLKESNKIVNTGDGAEYRFFTGALILANKFLDDNTFTNKTWADITGMKIKDVNHLEMQFLNGIDFRLFTSSSHYSEWLANLTQFTSMYMPSQHPVACQQQAAAAQSPISPMDHTSAPVDLVSSSVRPHGSGSELAQNGHMDTTLPLSMASISSYIDSVKQLQHRNVSTSRYQRTSGATAYSHHIQAPQSSTTHSSQQHYISLPQPSSVSSHSTGPYRVSSASYTSSPTMMPYTYQQGAPESIHRKRSAIIAFEDAMENAASYDSESLPHSTRAPVTVPSHKRFSSSSSATTLMGIVPSQDMFRNGSSPLAQQHHSHESSQQPSNFPVRNASQSTTFRGHHQRSASLSYYVDMGGYSTSYRQDLNQIALPMPNTFSRAGAVHPLERDQDQFRRPSSRADSFKLSQAVQHHGSQSTGGASTFQPATPPQYSSSKCESSCYSMGCDSNVNPGPSYDVDPRLWGPLDSLSLYAITTQAAKRVVAHSKALSSSANGLHMYYPTTLA